MCSILLCYNPLYEKRILRILPYSIVLLYYCDMDLSQAVDELCRSVAKLTFGPPVTHTYNPLLYARKSYAAYLQAYGQGRKRAVFFGMNPGPWGMAQTGVPFGDALLVKTWLNLCEKVGKPDPEHPRRPVLGFACDRREVSGARLWGAAREHFVTPERFFRHFFVANYCPFCFLEETGRNRTPDKLPAYEREPLFEACDEHLRRVVEILQPQVVVGVGAFAATRARLALEGSRVRVAQVLHPSPASPAANEGWAAKVATQLRELGLCPEKSAGP
jgi:single-strand selective monofunctional uracil DNA glycosylase